jgi:hypothetical protein
MFHLRPSKGSPNVDCNFLAIPGKLKELRYFAEDSFNSVSNGTLEMRD